MKDHSKIYGVSTGPGNPELLTLKAVRIIKEADIIAYPVDRSGKSVALSIAGQAVDINGKELLGLFFPMTRDDSELNEAWNEISNTVSERLRNGRTIAFLSLGDVSLYSTWGYLRSKMKELGFETETVPGVTAMSDVAAKLDRDLSSGDENLIVIPASVSDDELDALLDLKGSKVIMKAGRSLNLIIEKLKKRDLLQDSAMIINCGLPGEKIYRDLENADDAKGYFATILIKKESEK